jgi:hypothetical protein
MEIYLRCKYLMSKETNMKEYSTVSFSVNVVAGALQLTSFFWRFQ